MGCGSSTDIYDADKQEGKDVERPRTGWRRKQEQEILKIDLTDDVLQKYIDLEKQICRLEKKNVVKKYESNMALSDELKKAVDQLEAMLKELKKQTEKERSDVENLEQPSVRAFLKQQGTWDEKFSTGKQNYLDALNRQEVTEKELTYARSQYNRAAKITSIYKEKVDQLTDFYEEQDKLLAAVFGGSYGSEVESNLESELDDAMDWQQRVSLAKFKWTNARVLLLHACTQMAFGIKRWMELDQIDMSNTRMRYFAAAEARNNFIAAGQNIQSARVYLGKVTFPYCTPDEMKRLENAVNSAFTDVQAKDKFVRALDSYEFIHRKVSALVQWFDRVIQETIMKDLEGANNEVTELQKELRQERMRLITEKVKVDLGREINVNFEDLPEEPDDPELLALEAEKVSDADELPGENLMNMLSLQSNDGRRLTPLPTSQLAAAPSDNELFGNIRTLKQEHERARQALSRQQDDVKAKMTQGLQEKLAQRRTHTERLKLKASDLETATAVPPPQPTETVQIDQENGSVPHKSPVHHSSSDGENKPRKKKKKVANKAAA